MTGEPNDGTCFATGALNKHPNHERLNHSRLVELKLAKICCEAVAHDGVKTTIMNVCSNEPVFTCADCGDYLCAEHV